MQPKRKKIKNTIYYCITYIRKYEITILKFASQMQDIDMKLIRISLYESYFMIYFVVFKKYFNGIREILIFKLMFIKSYSKKNFIN